MITRRHLFRGLFAVVGAMVLKPFVKAEPKEVIMKYRQPGWTTLGFAKDIKYNLPDGTVHKVPDGWVHGSNSIDDVHFEKPAPFDFAADRSKTDPSKYRFWVADKITFENNKEKYFKNGVELETPWEEING